MKRICLIITCTICLEVCAQLKSKRPLPVIDMHLHCLPVSIHREMSAQLPAPIDNFGAWIQKESALEYFKKICNAKNSIDAAKTDDELRTKTLAILEKYNIYGVASGDSATLEKWKQSAPQRIIEGLSKFGTPENLKEVILQGKLKVFGELTLQYRGLTLSDSSMEPYLQICEEMDVPVAVHVGTGPPGSPYLGFSNYRARLHSPLTVEEALIRHPKLRVSLMHAGWPMIDDLLAVLFVHPQVYVDLGAICVVLPKKEFYYYLQRIVDAGFEKRIMFGSDQMAWPDAIVKGLETIQNAPFLTDAQKRDILFNNAARFLKLPGEQIQAMH